jgi:flagellin-like protein
MKKGITPIISIIILLLITIALAGVAYTFLMGQLYTRIGGTFDVPTGGAFCTNGLITVQVSNTGTADISSHPTNPAANDFITAQVDGVSVIQYLETTTIPPGQGGTILRNYNCTTSCASGPHTVDLGTESLILHPTVYCP